MWNGRSRANHMITTYSSIRENRRATRWQRRTRALLIAVTSREMESICVPNLLMGEPSKSDAMVSETGPFSFRPRSADPVEAISCAKLCCSAQTVGKLFLRRNVAHSRSFQLDLGDWKVDVFNCVGLSTSKMSGSDPFGWVESSFVLVWDKCTFQLG